MTYRKTKNFLYWIDENSIVSRETRKTEYGNKQDKELLNTLFHVKHIKSVAKEAV